MRNIFIAILLVIWVFDSEAQRLDLDKSSFHYSYRLMPNIALDKSYLSYTVKIAKADELGPLAGQSDSSKITITGRKKVSSKAHFTVYINLAKVIFGEAEVKSKVEVTKDKDGKETGRKTLYYIEFRYSFEATAEVRDYKEVKLATYKISSRDNAKVYKSAAFERSTVASELYNDQRNVISAKLISEEVNHAYTSFNTSLNNDFGIKAIESKIHLWNLGSQKHPEFQACQNACAIGIIVLEKINADSISSQANIEVKPAIEYFMSVESKYINTEEKTEKKLRYAAFYNLAQIYLCLEQFEKAKEYAQKLIANDFDVKDGKDIVEEVSTIVARLEKHQMTTQHFTLDLQHISFPQ